MATYSSTLAWRIPWTEEPGGYSSCGHNESDTTEVTEHASTHVLFSIVAAPIYVHTSSAQEFPFLQSSATFAMLTLISV